MSNLPTQYQFLEKEGAPLMLVAALKFYGIKEFVGARHNPIILGWAKELNIEKIYTTDETPWCGLVMAIIAKAGLKTLPFSAKDALWALNWRKFGVGVPVAMLGDVLVFSRKNTKGQIIGGHVALYVGEDATHYHTLGGNQSNMFNIVRIDKARVVAKRRPEYKNQPPNVRQIFLKPDGTLSHNEA